MLESLSGVSLESSTPGPRAGAVRDPLRVTYTSTQRNIQPTTPSNRVAASRFHRSPPVESSVTSSLKARAPNMPCSHVAVHM